MDVVKSVVTLFLVFAVASLAITFAVNLLSFLLSVLFTLVKAALVIGVIYLVYTSLRGDSQSTRT